MVFKGFEQVNCPIQVSSLVVYNNDHNLWLPFECIPECLRQSIRKLSIQTCSLFVPQLLTRIWSQLAYVQHLKLKGIPGSSLDKNFASHVQLQQDQFDFMLSLRMENLKSLEVIGCSLSQDELYFFTRASQLTNLELQYCVFQSGMIDFGRFEKLQNISLKRCQIPGAFYKFIVLLLKLKSLQVINFEGVQNLDLKKNRRNITEQVNSGIQFLVDPY
eukprot:TRINITY_DN65846_c0_g1_i5.p2 TRINITY_DN65846_c0_g1~~TRINITY_DN65846_c0_g1_i5.p2  ORF type:complete len:217 (-),score=10.29 TRINITY_DN65846_c0_g1_i5:199-849(-)